MTTAVELRLARPQDYPELFAAELASHTRADPDFGVDVTDPAHWSLHDFKRFARHAKHWLYVAREGELVVGCLGFEPGPGGVILHKLLVHPKFRRAGIATDMLEWLRGKLSRAAARRGGPYSKLLAYVREDDLTSLAFFKARGFRSVLVRRYWENGLDAVLFTRGLS